MQTAGGLLVACICQREVAVAGSFVQKSVSGKIDEDQITGACNVDAYLHDQALYQFARRVRAHYQLHISWLPATTALIDQPLSKRLRVRFGVL